jgi:hypothetical protein
MLSCTAEDREAPADYESAGMCYWEQSFSGLTHRQPTAITAVNKLLVRPVSMEHAEFLKIGLSFGRRVKNCVSINSEMPVRRQFLFILS